MTQRWWWALGACWLMGLSAQFAGCAETPAADPNTGGDAPMAGPATPGGATVAPPAPAEEDPVAAAITPELLEGKFAAKPFPADLEWLNTEKPLTLEQYKGKFVLLDFWTYCCINCMHVIPELRSLERKYPEELVVIGVHSAKFSNEKTTEQIRKAILRYEIEHPVVNDAEMAIWESYDVHSWPTLVLINPEGKVVGYQSGEDNEALFDAILKHGVKYFAQKGTLKKSPLKLKLEKQAKETPLSFPGKIAVSPATGAGAAATPTRLIVSDSNHNRILLVGLDGRIAATIGSGATGRADGDFATASFDHPQGVTQVGQTIYVADTENHLIRAIDLTRKKVTTVLGTGAKATRFNVPGVGGDCAINSPWDVAAWDGKLYIAMAGFHQIWAADLKTWAAEPFIGTGRERIVDGPRKESALAQPSGIVTVDGVLYWADSETSSIRMAPIADDGRVTTLIGKGLFDFGDVDGDSATARLQHPLGLTWVDGQLYVTDTYNDRIKKIDPRLRQSTAFAGAGSAGYADGAADGAELNEPGGVCAIGSTLYVADTNNHRIRTVDLKTGAVGTIATSNNNKP